MKIGRAAALRTLLGKVTEERGSRTRRNAVRAGLENKILAILPVIIRHFP